MRLILKAVIRIFILPVCFLLCLGLALNPSQTLWINPLEYSLIQEEKSETNLNNVLLKESKDNQAKDPIKMVPLFMLELACLTILVSKLAHKQRIPLFQQFFFFIKASFYPLGSLAPPAYLLIG